MILKTIIIKNSNKKILEFLKKENKRKRIMRKPDYRKCLVLDSGYMPRQIITSERAFVVSLKGNANIIHNHPEKFGLVNPDLEIYRPSVIVVPKYINTHFYKLPPTRDNIFKRDDYTCVYCGYNDMRAMTLDHVIPKSKGGEDTWENLVTACRGCNSEKDNLTIEEWGKEHPNPKRPHRLMFLKKLTYIPEEWKKYLLI